MEILTQMTIQLNELSSFLVIWLKNGCGCLEVCGCFLASVFMQLIPLIGHRAVLGLSGYVLNNIRFFLLKYNIFKNNFKRRHNEKY